MHAVACRVHHHCARAIDEVARGNLGAALLQAIFERAVFAVRGDFAMDGEDRTDTGIHIDVRRPVQRIEHQNVFAFLAAGRKRNDVFRFFRRHRAEMSVVAHRATDCFLCKNIELLHRVSVKVGFAGSPQNLHETCHVDFARNNFRGQRETRHQRCEITGRLGMHPLFIKYVLLNCFYFAHVWTLWF